MKGATLLSYGVLEVDFLRWVDGAYESLVLEATHQVVGTHVPHAWSMHQVLIPEVAGHTEALDDIFRARQQLIYDTLTRLVKTSRDVVVNTVQS